MNLNPFRRQRAPRHRFSAHQIASAGVEESVRQLAARMDKWQERVMRYARIVPEVMTGYLFVHNTMDMVDFVIERFDREKGDWVRDESPEMRGIEKRINTFRAGRAAALLHLVEEAWVLVTREGAEYRFETLAPTEIRSKSIGVVEKRVLIDGQKSEWVRVSSDTTMIRVYTEDPADRDKASGPHQPLLELLETMAVELLRDRSEAISVLAGNGILFIPAEILPDDGPDLDASDAPGSRKAFENALEESMLLTITDRSKGEAVVPITLYGQADYGEKIRHILPQRPESPADAKARMDGYVARYAKSIDLPEQVILGSGDSNHWNVWKVDENTWAYHLEPRGQRIANALYRGIVASVITNLDRNPADYRLAPDPSRAIAKTDMSRSAVDAYKMGAITPEAFLRALGFEPSDMRPDAEETLLQILAGDAAAEEDGMQGNTPPDRTAAGSLTPRAILRQAGRIANVHNRRRESAYRRIMESVAKDAAAAAQARAKAPIADRAAAGRINFLGYEPGVYFAKYADVIETATAEELFAFLKRVATLTGQDYRHLRSVWETEFAHRAAAVRQEAAAMAESIAKRSFESGKAVRVPQNVMRTLSSIAAGGANQTNGAAGNTARPTHAGEDPALRAALTESVGRFVTQYTWVTGEPARPYPPHEELDGNTWFSWEEFDTLDVTQGDSWLPGGVYFPGDHDGCQCSYEIEFVPAAQAA